MHFKAIEAHLKQNGRLPVNMKFILEGEEEVGSAQPRRLHPRPQGRCSQADVVVISDSPMFDRGMPSICYGLRGLVYFQIDLRGTQDATCTPDRSAARSPTRPSCSRRCSRR